MLKELKSKLEEKFGPYIIARIITAWIGIMMLCISFIVEMKLAICLLVISVFLLGWNLKLLIKYKDRF